MLVKVQSGCRGGWSANLARLGMGIRGKCAILICVGVGWERLAQSVAFGEVPEVDCTVAGKDGAMVR